MNRSKGFTLVELLVVMAIISILAAIAVPNIIGRIERARGVRAVSEIRNIDLAITNILADAGVNSLHRLFKPDGVRVYLGITDQMVLAGNAMLTQQAFDRAQELYTRVLYAVLREGRQALVDTDPVVGNFAQYLEQGIVSKLGTTYFNDLAFDPWGNLYQIYPGPWPSEKIINSVKTNQIPFRIYSVTTNTDATRSLPGSMGGGKEDELTLYKVIDPETGLEETHGYAAPREEVAFIWSNGGNLISGQALYRQVGYLPPNQTDYYPPQEPEFMGGGDDVNNWDNGASWERFYN